MRIALAFEFAAKWRDSELIQESDVYTEEELQSTTQRIGFHPNPATEDEDD